MYTNLSIEVYKLLYTNGTVHHVQQLRPCDWAGSEHPLDLIGVRDLNGTFLLLRHLLMDHEHLVGIVGSVGQDGVLGGGGRGGEGRGGEGGGRQRKNISTTYK